MGYSGAFHPAAAGLASRNRSALHPAMGRKDSPTTCPRCGDALMRVHRRFVDRLWSLLQPVRRYRCDNPGCGWVGNLLAPRR